LIQAEFSGLKQCPYIDYIKQRKGVFDMKIRLTLTEEVLGSSPNKEDIYREFIASKAPDAATIEDEVAAIGVDSVMDGKKTVFPRNEDGVPCLYDYQVRGFFKEAFAALAKAGKAGYQGGQHCANLKAYKKTVDQQLFVVPRMIPYQYGSQEVGSCVRPLRADTAQGTRVALASSETVPAGAFVEFETIEILPELEDCIKEALEYGQFHGLGQWRNSGKGAFTYEILEENNIEWVKKAPAKKAASKKQPDEPAESAESEADVPEAESAEAPKKTRRKRTAKKTESES
jgi:hypothetical protein